MISYARSMPAMRACSKSRTHFINRREMRSAQKGRWQGARRVVWRCHTQGAQRGQRPFWAEPGGSGPFGRIAALRIWVKTPSLDPNSRLALHPKRDSLALTPIYEMSSSKAEFAHMFNNADTLEKCKHGSGHRRYTWSNLGWPSTIRDYLSGGESEN